MVGRTASRRLWVDKRDRCSLRSARRGIADRDVDPPREALGRRRARGIAGGSLAPAAHASRGWVGPGYYGINFQQLRQLPPSERSKHLSQIAKLGIRDMRVGFAWPRIEPLPPVGGGHQYRWGALDGEIRALAQHGIRAQANITQTPRWNADTSIIGAINCNRSSSWAPLDIGPYRPLVKAIASRFGKGGTFWKANPGLPAEPIERYEIWNEPNLRGGWCPNPQPERYADMFMTAANAIHSVDPHAEVVTGGVAPPAKENKHYLGISDFLGRVTARQPGLVRKAGGAAVHIYPADRRRQAARPARMVPGPAPPGRDPEPHADADQRDRLADPGRRRGDLGSEAVQGLYGRDPEHPPHELQRDGNPAAGVDQRRAGPEEPRGLVRDRKPHDRQAVPLGARLRDRRQAHARRALQTTARQAAHGVPGDAASGAAGQRWRSPPDGHPPHREAQGQAPKAKLKIRIHGYITDASTGRHARGRVRLVGIRHGRRRHLRVRDRNRHDDKMFVRRRFEPGRWKLVARFSSRDEQKWIGRKTCRRFKMPHHASGHHWRRAPVTPLLTERRGRPLVQLDVAVDDPQRDVVVAREVLGDPVRDRHATGACRRCSRSRS